ncbi:MAG: transketolase family protein [Thermodesulfovibrionales bacterium]|nr:transketolase family protein [Thermodesulfovibrionales bacterium]
MEIKSFSGVDAATRDAYGEVLYRIGLENPDIVVLDADLSSSTKTQKFAKAFPERFFNMGVSEQDMMATAAGLSLSGKIPFASTFAIFATGRAWEQIRQSIAYSCLNVKIVATHGGITVGEDGASHQAIEDIALMRVIPGMTVIVPADAYETELVIKEIVKYKGPVYVRLGRAKVRAVMPQEYRFSIGKAHAFGFGKDVNIIACGVMVAEALIAAGILKENGVDAGVINMSTIKPLDEEMLLKASDASLIVTAEEHSVIGGLGGAVCEFLSSVKPKPVLRIGIRDRFGTSGSSGELMKFFKLTGEQIAEDILSVLRNA